MPGTAYVEFNKLNDINVMYTVSGLLLAAQTLVRVRSGIRLILDKLADGSHHAQQHV